MLLLSLALVSTAEPVRGGAAFARDAKAVVQRADGTVLATEPDRGVRIWAPDSLRPTPWLTDPQLDLDALWETPDGRVRGVGARLTDRGWGSPAIFEVRSGAWVKLAELSGTGQLEAGARGVTWRHDGHAFRRWTAPGAPRQTWTDAERYLDHVWVGDDGRAVVTAGRKLTCLDGEGEVTGSLHDADYRYHAVLGPPSGSPLVAVAAGTIRSLSLPGCTLGPPTVVDGLDHRWKAHQSLVDPSTNLAVLAAHEQLMVVDLATLERRASLPHLARPSLVPGGGQIVAIDTRSGVPRRVDLRAPAPPEPLLVHSGPVTRACALGDGWATVDDEGTVLTWSEDLTPRMHYLPKANLGGPDLHCHGDELLWFERPIEGGTDRMLLRRARAGEEGTILVDGALNPSVLAVAADGSDLLWFTEGGGTSTAMLRSGDKNREVAQVDGRPRLATWGERQLYGSYTNFFLVSQGEAASVDLPINPRHAESFGSRFVLAGGDAVVLWDPQAGYTELLRSDTGIVDVSAAPAAGRVAVALGRGGAVLLDVPSGKVLSRVDGEVGAVAVRPDGGAWLVARGREVEVRSVE